MTDANASVVATQPKMFDMSQFAVATTVVAEDITKLEIGQGFLATISSFRPIKTKFNKPTIQVTGKTSSGLSFNALVDGSLSDGLAIKNCEVTFVFRGLNVVDNKTYPKLSVQF